MRSIGDYLKRRTLKGPLARLRALDALLSAVRQALPEPLAGHCVGAVSQDRQLVLFADSPLWATRLRYAAPILLEGLGAAARGFREVRVRVMLPPAGSAPPAPPPRALPAEVARLVEETAAGLEDRALGDALARLARRAAAPRGGGSG